MAKYKLRDAVHTGCAALLVDISALPDRLALYVNENAGRARGPHSSQHSRL